MGNLISKEVLEEEIFDPEKLNFLKKGKVRIVIHYEDESTKTIYKKIGQNYVFSVGKYNYFIVPRCILKGEIPTIHYFHNNPCPIEFKYKYSDLTAAKLRSEKEFSKLQEDQQTILISTFIDAQALQSCMNSKILSGLYNSNKLSLGAILIIVGGVLAVILILLHVTGTVDVVSFITGASG